VRVAINHINFGRSGGVEGYLRRLVEHLNGEKAEIHFFGRKVHGPRDGLFTFHRVGCIPFPQSLRVMTFAYRSARLVRAGGFDITLGFGRTFGHDLHRDSNGSVEAFHAAAKSVLSPAPFHRRVIKHLERKLYTAPDLLHTIAVSRFIKDQIAERYHVPDSRLSVVYNGVDTSRLTPENRSTLGAALRAKLGLDRERLAALFVGHDWRRKGLMTAIEGIRKARVPWDLWVLGGERRAAEFHRHVAAIGLEQRVRFVGPADARAYYAAADAMIFPSLFDPLANVVLEAMASGLPVIVSPTDGAAELIRQGENGFVLDHARDAAQVASILESLADANVRHAIGSRARQTAAPLTWQRHLRELDRIIDLTISEKRARPR
jgi:UDP-glucose:(heptosyl)LPS alpha-1,3-glucosyltransferase